MAETNFDGTSIPVIDLTDGNNEPHSKRQKLDENDQFQEDSENECSSESEPLVFPMSNESVDKSKFFENVLDYFDYLSPLNQGPEHEANWESDLEDNLECVSKPLHAETAKDSNTTQLLRMALNAKVVQKENILVSRQPATADVVQTLFNYQPGNESSSEKENDLRQIYENVSPKPPTSVTDKVTDECCVVDYLAKRFGDTMSGIPTPLIVADDYVRRGRPMPAIPPLGISYHFYQTHSWLTGCPKLKKLFCWPCLLFNYYRNYKSINTVWMKEGFDDMPMMVQAIARHARTETHKCSVRTLEKVNSRISGGVNFQVINPKPLTLGVGEHSVKNPERATPLIVNSTIVTDNHKCSASILGHTNNRISNSGHVQVNKSKPLTLGVGEQAVKNSERATPPIPNSTILTNSHKRSASTLEDVNNRISNSGHVQVNKSKPLTLGVGEQCVKNPERATPPIANSTIVTDSHKRSASTLEHVNNRISNSSHIQVNKSEPLKLGVGEQAVKNSETAPIPNSKIVSDNGSSQTGGLLTQRKIINSSMEISPMKAKAKTIVPQQADNQIKRGSSDKTMTLHQTFSSPVNVKLLQLKHFFHGQWTESERAQIIAAGRPKPNLPYLKQFVGDCVRQFSATDYENIKWLCGSTELNRLFCWPCLLFNRHNYRSDIWNTVGFNYLSRLETAAKHHSLSQLHLEASIRLIQYEEELKKKAGVSKPGPDSPQKIDQSKQEVLKYLIDCVCFKKKQINNINLDHDDYHTFFKILSSYDKSLENYFNPNSFKFSPDLSPDFIRQYSSITVSSLETILKRRITSDVKSAAFVSMILHSIQRGTVALILRYVTSDNQIRETFFDFIKIGFGLPEALKAQIIDVANQLSLGNKFVGLSYDGGLLRPDQVSSFNLSLREEYPSAHFFNHWNGNLKLLLQQSLSNSQQCRLFFHLIEELRLFLRDNPKVMRCVSQSGTDNKCASNWNLGSWFLITLYEQYPAIVKFLHRVTNQGTDQTRMENVESQSKESRCLTSSTQQRWSNHVISQCTKFKIFLSLDETKLLVVLISKVFFIIHSLTETIMGEFNAKNWRKCIDDTFKRIRDSQSNKFHFVCQEAENITGENKKFSKCRQKLVALYDQTFDWTIAFLKARLVNFDVWSLFTVGKYINVSIAKARNKFPDIQSVLKEYFPSFDSNSLSSSLIFAGNNSLFADKTAEASLKIMDDLALHSVLPDLRRFLVLLMTIPFSSANVKSLALDKLVTYAEDKKELNSTEALFYAESDLLSALQREAGFHDMVIKTISEEENRQALATRTKPTKPADKTQKQKLSL